MASFTDKPMQFNPYIQQLPVEEMVKVGMIKQDQYDKGVQKIQGQIDQVAGLDIYKDVDKAYLKSKLNQLGGNLTTVAAGDFSNFQLVNSVGGMVKQIGNDKIVQTAVGSTAWLRKQQAIMEKAKKEGKSGVQNEKWFNAEANAWFQDPNAGAVFTEEYINYTDIDAKLRDIAEKVHGADGSIDIPYKRNYEGNVLYYDTQGNASLDPSKGVKKIDDVMLRISVKGRSAEKLLNNFYNNLTPNDQQQLKIDGWYHYRGATKDTFKNDITKTYNINKKILSDAAVDIALELKTNSKLNIAEKAELQTKLTNINKKLTDGSLEKELNTSLSGINNITDLTDYKYKLYTQKHLTTMAQDMADESKKMEILNSPYFEADMKKQDIQYKYWNANLQHSEWKISHKWDVQKWTIEQSQKEAERLKKIYTAIDPGALPTDVDVPSLSKIDGDITAIIGQRDAKGNLIQAGQIDELNSSYAPNIPGGDKMTPTQKSQYLNDLYKKYSENPTSINDNDNKMRKYLEQRKSLEVESYRLINLRDGASKSSKQYDEQLDQSLANETPITTSNGSVLYTPKELFLVSNVATSFKTTTSFSGGTGGFGGGVTTFDTKGFLDKYRGGKYEPIAKAYVKKYYGQQLTPTENVIYNNTVNINQKYSSIASDLVKKKLTAESDYLTKNMPERQTKIGTLNMSNADTKEMVNGLIGNKLIQYESHGGLDVNKSSDFSKSDLEKIQKDPNAKYTIVKKYDGSAELVLNGGGGLTQRIPINAGELQRHFSDVAVVNPWDDIKYTISSSPNKTTNLLALTDATGAVSSRFTGSDIPLLRNTKFANNVRVDVEGDDRNDGGPNDVFQVKMYVQPYVNTPWVMGVLNEKGFVSLTGAQKIFENIGTQTINDFLKKNN
jgi:predicted transcriptional regulator